MNLKMIDELHSNIHIYFMEINSNFPMDIPLIMKLSKYIGSGTPNESFNALFSSVSDEIKEI